MNGFFNVLKPSGITSSDVVVKLRRMLGAVTGKRLKVGHLGTLDPLGSGVLPIAIGSATKLFDYLLDKTKLYRAKFVFGLTTDTLDAAGKIEKRNKTTVTAEDIKRVLPQFVGKIDQLPPRYSSKNINGERAYKLARRGIDVELKSKVVEIFDISLIGGSGDEYVFDISCGGGTYIRSLCRDIATALNTTAYMASIIRMENGDFRIEDANTLDEIEQDVSGCFIPLTTFADTLPRYDVDNQHKKSIDNGIKLRLTGMPNGLFVLYIGGAPYGVAVSKEERLIVIVRYD